MVGSLYDPKVFIGGILLEGKLIYQECNKLPHDWDTTIGDILSLRWEKDLKKLRLAEAVRVPRFFNLGGGS